MRRILLRGVAAAVGATIGFTSTAVITAGADETAPTGPVEIAIELVPSRGTAILQGFAKFKLVVDPSEGMDIDAFARLL